MFTFVSIYKFPTGNTSVIYQKTLFDQFYHFIHFLNRNPINNAMQGIFLVTIQSIANENPMFNINLSDMGQDASSKHIKSMGLSSTFPKHFYRPENLQNRPFSCSF